MSDSSPTIIPRSRLAIPLVVAGVALWMLTLAIAVDLFAPGEAMRWLGRTSFFGGGLSLAFGLRYFTRG